jgi:hypothetical protein
MGTLSKKERSVNDTTCNKPFPACDKRVETLGISNLKIKQNFETMVGIKNKVRLEVRKPYKTEFIRVRGGEPPTDVYILELKERCELYLIHPSIGPRVPEANLKRLFVCTNRDGLLFLWLIKLPDSGGRLDRWNYSYLEAASLAETKWIKVTPNLGQWCCHTEVSPIELPEPSWSGETTGELIEITFRGFTVCNINDPILRRLRGEI